MQSAAPSASVWREVLVFFFLCLIAWPLFGVAAIGVYGIGAWIRLAVGGSV